MEHVIPSPEEVQAGRTPNGGWTKAQLAEWGIGWPPPKGWREQLARRHARQARRVVNTAEYELDQDVRVHLARVNPSHLNRYDLLLDELVQAEAMLVEAQTLVDDHREEMLSIVSAARGSAA